MFKSTFINFSDGHLVAIGFVLFMTVFLGTFIWTVFVQKDSFYRDLSGAPLREKDQHGKQ